MTVVAMNKARQRLRFGPFEMSRKGELTRAGVPVRLAPQPSQVLAMLVRRAGELVTREEIRAEVWGGTVVEFDLAVNYCIREIRKALGDDANQPRYVETVPKRGYRLVAPVAEAAPAAPVDAGVARAFREAEHLSVTWELEKTRKAAELYRQVIEAEPGFAAAYAGLVNALVILPFMGAPQDPSEVERLALRALELDDSLALTHTALAHGWWHQWRWAEAGEAFRRAVALDPECTVAHQLYGLYLVSVGRCAEAIEHGQWAAEREPTVGVMQYSLAQIYLHSGRAEDAVRQNLHTLEVARHYPNSYASLVRAYLLLGEPGRAGAVLEEWERVSGPGVAGPWRAYWLTHAGRMEEARVAFAGWWKGASEGGRLTYGSAVARLALGDAEGALALLEQSVARHTPTMLWLKVAPETLCLHGEPQYRRLLEQMGLV